jgi:ribonuclease R
VLLDEFFVDGLIHVSSLEDDYYHFREREYSLVGERRHRRFRLGDRVRVKVVRVDREERKVDFLLVHTHSNRDV